MIPSDDTAPLSPDAAGFLALPLAGAGPGVLVLHAWWGLNDTIKAVCMRLAEAGFVAFAPDLYRGETAETVADAERLGAALDVDHVRAKADITRAVDDLRTPAGGSGLAGRAVTFHRYDGVGHWFREPDRTDAYGQAAADLAWQRTLAFLRRSTAG